MAKDGDENKIKICIIKIEKKKKKFWCAFCGFFFVAPTSRAAGAAAARERCRGPFIIQKTIGTGKTRASHRAAEDTGP